MSAGVTAISGNLLRELLLSIPGPFAICWAPTIRNGCRGVREGVEAFGKVDVGGRDARDHERLRVAPDRVLYGIQ